MRRYVVQGTENRTWVQTHHEQAQTGSLVFNTASNSLLMKNVHDSLLSEKYLFDTSDVNVLKDLTHCYKAIKFADSIGEKVVSLAVKELKYGRNVLAKEIISVRGDVEFAEGILYLSNAQCKSVGDVDKKGSDGEDEEEKKGGENNMDGVEFELLKLGAIFFVPALLIFVRLQVQNKRNQREWRERRFRECLNFY